MTVQFMTAGGAAAAVNSGAENGGFSAKQRVGTRSW